LLHRGLAELGLGSIDAALRTAGELKISVDSGPNRKAIRYYDLLMGMIALKKENFSEAVERDQRAAALLPFQYSWENDQALFLDALAWAHLQKGDLDQARGEYEKILRLTFGRQYFGDIYARSFYQLGRIYEQQGQKDLARQNYEKFLDLWKDADPGLPEVEDARKRLAGL
jgi:tetratricopeptide (TPR) repeat protein